MKAKALTAFLAIGVMALILSACGGEQEVDVKKLMAQPKAFVGSDTCKMCHLEHFDSWMMTLHSRMTQDPQKNKDVIIADLDEKKIREDLAKIAQTEGPGRPNLHPKSRRDQIHHRQPVEATLHRGKERHALYSADQVLSRIRTAG